MGEKALAQTIYNQLVRCGRKIILVRNLHSVIETVSALEPLLSNMRIVVIDCSCPESIRKSIRRYFTGDGLPEVSIAFDAGWRSHITEVSLCSGGDGFEIAAGLHSVKHIVKAFLLEENRSEELDTDVFVRVISSFAWSLPTLICFDNYTGRAGSCVSALQMSSHFRLPSLLVCRRDDGDFRGADSVVESGMMSSESIRNHLETAGCSIPLEKVFVATSGDTGLVSLYIGLFLSADYDGDDVFVMLDSFLEREPDLARFAVTAAVFGTQFMYSEICAVACIDSQEVFATGKSINLWSGHLVGCFLCERVRSHLTRDMPQKEKDRLLRESAGEVLRNRGYNTNSYRIAGDLLVRAGDTLPASFMYEKAAGLAAGEFLKADLYRRAWTFSEKKSDQLLFLAAINLYRGEFYPEAIDVLDSFKDQLNNSSVVLRELCATSSDESHISSSVVAAVPAFPELAVEILVSRELHRQGLYSGAEEILSDKTGGNSVAAVACLVELGEQLYKRGMVGKSLIVMTEAVEKSSVSGLKWLERKALFACLKACNRIGKHKRVRSELSRLIELTLASGNKRKLVAVYNLYANSLIMNQNYIGALNIYSTSLKTVSSIPKSSGVKTIILNNMSVAQRRLFRTGEALRTLMRQVRISVSTGNLSKACIAYGNMSRQFIDLYKLDEASDCLETMIEFAEMGKIAEATETICYISSQLAIMNDHPEEALAFIDQSISISRESGKKRRLSMNLVKKGSMLLRLKRYRQAVIVLSEAADVSMSAGSGLNVYVAKMKLAAARCFLGEGTPADLLAVEYTGSPEDTHRGEQMYYHWLLTGSRQSLTATAQLLSKGLTHGLYYYSYLFMLQHVRNNMPSSLADAIPLVHNYPSCE